MVICMKTTLNLDPELMKSVKQRALDTNQTITALVETSLRQLLAREHQVGKPYRFDWKPVSGKLIAPVDISNRDSLLDFLDENP